MMLNVLAHHLFETDLQGNDNGINGAPPPATQDIIDNLKETPALEMHIGMYRRTASEMDCLEGFPLHFFQVKILLLIYKLLKRFKYINLTLNVFSLFDIYSFFYQFIVSVSLFFVFVSTVGISRTSRVLFLFCVIITILSRAISKN